MPAGYLSSLLIIVLGVILSIAPVRRPWSFGIASWLLSAQITESVTVAVGYLVLSTALAFDQDGAVVPVIVVSAALTAMLLVAAAPILARRSLRTGPILHAALHSAFPDHTPTPFRALPWRRIVFSPIPLTHRGVRRVGGLRYGEHRRQRLDVHLARRRSNEPAPVLIHLPGGGFRTGPRSFYARAMLHTLARRGWLTVSAGYRLRPACYRDMVDDVGQVVAWVRDHAHRWGADPTRIILSGSSAGASLALSGGFSAPGVAGVVGLYGYYGPVSNGPDPLSPLSFLHPAGPPVLIAHGANDSLVPVESVRPVVAGLAQVSRAPVVHVELPGGQHTFDLLYSIRFCRLIDGIEAFARSVFARRPQTAHPR